METAMTRGSDVHQLPENGIILENDIRKLKPESSDDRQAKDACKHGM